MDIYKRVICFGIVGAILTFIAIPIALALLDIHGIVAGCVTGITCAAIFFDGALCIGVLTAP